MGGHEQALIQQTVVAQGGAALLTDAGAGQTHSGPFDEVVASGQISSGGGQTAAGVLDERAYHQVSAHVGGFLLLHKLPVAVVHQNGNIGVVLADDLAHVANLVHRQRGPGGVALGALDEYRFHLGVRHGLGQSLQVGRILRGEVHLAVFHAEVLQGPGAFVGDTDDTQQGVVGSANGGDQHVSGTQAAKQGRRNGVGAVDKPDAH